VDWSQYRIPYYRRDFYGSSHCCNCYVCFLFCILLLSILDEDRFPGQAEDVFSLYEISIRTIRFLQIMLDPAKTNFPPLPSAQANGQNVGDISVILSEGLSEALQGSIESAISACNSLVKRSDKRNAIKGKRQTDSEFAKMLIPSKKWN
jgi:hypothetical protein